MWYDPETNLLIYEERDPRILQYVPEARQVNGAYTALPASLINLQILRTLGYKVIRPLSEYDWPRARSIKQPFFAQHETANFLAVTPRACVLSDMGTGKTLAALWAAEAMMRDAEHRGEVLRALIVAPLSTLHSVWEEAIFAHFMGRRTCVVLHGPEKKRVELLAQPADFYIVNHDGIKVGGKLNTRRKLELSGFIKTAVERADIRLVIVDEVGAFRNSRSLRSRVARILTKDRDYLWLMTGTPTPNGPEDAYGIGFLLNGCRGEPFTHYKSRIMYQVSQFKWLPRPGANEEANKLMYPSIRFKIEDCQDLPELVTQTREAELSSEQQEYIKSIKRDLVLQLAKGTISVANEAALRLKLMQISCGVVYDENHNGQYINCQPRLTVLKELIEEAGGKVIIFAPFISAVNMLNNHLTEYTRAIILGSTPVKERTEIIKAFQQSADPQLLIAHPETISHGQTLTAAATIIWYGPTDKTDVYIQANKRIHRPGQTRTCTVVNLVSTKVEREVYNRLEHNTTMQGCLLKLVEKGT